MFSSSPCPYSQILIPLDSVFCGSSRTEKRVRGFWRGLRQQQPRAEDSSRLQMQGKSRADDAVGGAAKEGRALPPRPRRSFYVPPHFRNNRSNPMFNDSHAFPQFSRDSATAGRMRSSQEHNRTRVHRRDRGRAWESNPFDTADKLSQLDISEQNDGNSAINFDAYEDIPVEITGSHVPSPLDTFSEIDMGEALNMNITRCKFFKPTPVQRHAIPIAMAGRDLMACAQTGSGKTAAFCFPIISRILKSRSPERVPKRGSRLACPLALILSPTRELSCQIHDEIRKFSYQTGVRVVVAYGGTPVYHQLRDLERGVDILVATPGRLVDLVERTRVSLQYIKYLTLDEADRMLDMGFEPQIRKIVVQMDMPPAGLRQTMLFSATFPNEIQRLASDFMLNYIFLTVGRVGSSTDLICQRIEYVQEVDKRSHLLNLIHAQRESGAHGKLSLTLVFVETKRGADMLEHWLERNGLPATAIHGDKTQMEREQALRSFKSGATPIMVATDVASRGLDIPHVAHVINFDLPRDIDDYVHRIGRTGRAGKSGLATAFFTEGNQPLARALADVMQEANQEVPEWLNHYAEKPSYGGGRNRRFGGSRFGGRDNRREMPTREGTAESSDICLRGMSNTYAPASYASTGNDSSFVDGFANNFVNHLPISGTIVATGWD